MTIIPTTPSIVLIDPKYPHNVGMVIRLAACYGIDQVWVSGDRFLETLGSRLPREERMKGYQSVQLLQSERPIDEMIEANGHVVPVAVEVRENSESLEQFEHPEHAVYVFGPEDGSVPKGMLKACHRFVVIPTRHCLNLATAVATVLWDRQVKLGLASTNPGAHEQRGFESMPQKMNGQFEVVKGDSLKRSR